MLVGAFANHLTANHSLHFVDPITYVHTNKGVSFWQSLRYRLSQGGFLQNQMDSHILEYLWQQDYKNHGADSFQELIEDIKTVCPVQQKVFVFFFSK